jgi:hypothetical protein
VFGVVVLFKLMTGYRGASSYVHPEEPFIVALPEALMWAGIVFVAVMIWPGQLRSFDRER